MLGAQLPDWAIITISIVICVVSIIIDIAIQYHENK